MKIFITFYLDKNKTKKHANSFLLKKIKLGLYHKDFFLEKKLMSMIK